MLKVIINIVIRIYNVQARGLGISLDCVLSLQIFGIGMYVRIIEKSRTPVAIFSYLFDGKNGAWGAAYM
jgi:hypothetical protein